LTKYFVEKLLMKLQISQLTIDKCMKVPLKMYARILELIHTIANRRLPYKKLAILQELLGCKELKVIKKRLMDPKIFNNVRNYLTRHMNLK